MCYSDWCLIIYILRRKILFLRSRQASLSHLSDQDPKQPPPPPTEQANPTKTLPTRRTRIQATQQKQVKTTTLLQKAPLESKKEIQKATQWEKRKSEETLAQPEDNTKKQVSSQYGIYPDLSLSSNLNARRVFGNTPINSYFSRVQNLAFHDLTLSQKVPKAAAEVLDLGLKFIPTSSSLTTKSKAQASAREVTRNVLLKAFFAG